MKASETGWPTRACSRAASTAVLPFSMVNNSVFSLNHLTILIDPCTGYLGYPCEKSVIDDAIRSFPAPSLHQAGGDSVAHVAVYCSVLEWISLSSQYRGLGCLLSFLPSMSRSQALLTRLRLHDLKCLLHCFSKKTVDAFAVEKLTSTAKIKVVKQFTVVQLLAGSGSTPTITSAKLASRKLNAVSLVPRRCNRSWPLGASPSLPGTA